MYAVAGTSSLLMWSGHELWMSSSRDSMLILPCPHFYFPPMRQGILVRDCMHGLLHHVRLSIGGAPISSRFVLSEYELIKHLFEFTLNFVLLYGTILLRRFLTHLNLFKDLLLALCILFDVFHILISLDLEI